MTGPAVLSLDEVAVVEVMRLIQAGLARPGRITNRGAIVYELTEAGVAAFEGFCAAPYAESDLGACHEGECRTGSQQAEALKAWQERGEEIGHLIAGLEANLGARAKRKVAILLADIRELLLEDSGELSKEF